MSGIVGSAGSKSGIIKSLSSFLARGEAGWDSYTNGQVIPFDDVSTGACFDVGGNYDTSAKKYTAPYTGKYFFWFNIYTAENDSNNSFTFAVNGTDVAFIDSAASEITWQEGTDDKTAHGHANIHLNAGDYVQVVAAHTSDANGSLATFGGFYMTLMSLPHYGERIL